MRRTLVILSFIAGISFASLPVCAQGTDAASEQFVEVFLGVKKAEEQEKAGDMKAALALYRAALTTLTKIKKENPAWQADLIDHRVKTTSDAIARVQEKVGGAAVKPGANDPELLPPLVPVDPLEPPPAVPRGKASKTAPPDDGNPDPLTPRRPSPF